MSDPSLVNNLDEFKKVTKEHNRLKPIVEKSIIFINSKNQLSENLDLIENEKDTDRDVGLLLGKKCCNGVFV